MREQMKKSAVLRALGVGNSTLYKWVAEGKIKPPHKVDPSGSGRGVAWWDNEVEEVQAQVLANGPSLTGMPRHLKNRKRRPKLASAQAEAPA